VSASASKYASARLVLASANVCTLAPRDEDAANAQVAGDLLMGKVQIMEQRFQEFGVQIVGVQEGRSRRHEVRSGLHFQMFAGMADNGVGGCQVWVSNALKFRVGEFLAPSARCTIVTGTITDDNIPLVLVSAHALTAAATDKAREDYWDDLSRQILEVRSRHPLALFYLLVDANARLEANMHASVGPFNGEETTDNGLHLVAMMQRLELSAYNTFFDAGDTWCSAAGIWHRIDYVCGPCSTLPDVRFAWCPDDLDLSLSTHRDHRAVLVEVDAVMHVRPAPRPKAETRIAKHTLSEPCRIAYFQAAMDDYATPAGSVDLQAAHFARYTKGAAICAFGSRRDAPRKPWISATTWSVLREVTPMRRYAFHAARHRSLAYIAVVFTAWAASCPCGYEPGKPVPSLGWAAASRLGDLHGAWRWMSKAAAVAWRMVHIASKAARRLVTADRLLFLQDRASAAADAASRGDSGASYAVVRSLAGRNVGRQPTHIRKPDGQLTRTDDERDQSWLQHFGRVFDADEVTFDVLERQQLAAPLAERLDFGEHEVACAINRLRRNRGMGSDGLPAEVLQAGGTPLVRRLTPLYRRVADEERWPVRWAGGRLAEVFKNKGARDDPDEYRGIVLEDHLAKGMKEVIAPSVFPAYNSGIPDSQHGAVGGRGTDMAAFLLQCFIAYCDLHAFSYFVLFVDLVKAFDKVIREVTLGIPPHVDDPYAYLRARGLTDEQANWIAQWVGRHHSQFLRWGMSPKVVRLLCNLHVVSWITFGSCDTALAVLKGGRQGCKYGAAVFNSTFALAMQLILEELMDAGLTVKLRQGSPNFWDSSTPAAAPTAVEVDAADDAFVDDEAFFACAKDAARLDVVIGKMLTVICRVYELLALEMSFKPKKTEAFLKYRGKGSTAAREARRIGPKGEIMVAIPSSVPMRLIRVVSQYKHLGSVATDSQSLFPDAKHKKCNAMQAYAPLATKIFGSPAVAVPLRLSFVWSLVLSRLLYACHIFVPSVRYLRELSCVYMRAIRRVFSCPRFGPSETDLEVRRRAKIPSVDCLLCRARLRFLGRILRRQPPQVVAFLSVRHQGKPLPWVTLIREDLRRLRLTVAICSALPDPEESEAWCKLILDSPGKWAAAVNCVHFSDSAADTAVAAGPGDDQFALAHGCPECGQRFPTARALGSHRRIKHRVLCEQRHFAPESGVCPACDTQFRSRLRLLAHLCDTRRTCCWDQVRGNSRLRLAPTLVERLDRDANKARLAAHRSGHSHDLAVGAAIRADGRITGRARL